MLGLVDTCGWIEWLTDGELAEEFAPSLTQPDNVIVPTSVQFELYKWVKREAGEAKALEVIAATENCRVMPLEGAVALLAADLALEHRLSFADAIIYATARFAGATLVTSDDHFEGLSHVTLHDKRQY